MNPFLNGMAEPMPQWLEQLRPGDSFPVNDFFNSRLVYYPGAGLDGQPVKLFGGGRFAHCFLYVDYGLTQERIEAALHADAGRYDGGFLGYSKVTRFQLSERDLTPRGWRMHVVPREAPMRRSQGPPFGMAVMLERDAEFDESHGPQRLAIMFLGADGIATYDALFCQAGVDRMPEVMVLQDHGFGGNYNRFERGGLLEELAQKTGRSPRWLYIADENTEPWSGYHLVNEAGEERGGSGNHRRRLYRKA